MNWFLADSTRPEILASAVRLAAVLVGWTLIGLSGCGPRPDSKLNESESVQIPAENELQRLIDTELEAILRDRHLDIEQHAAWQILHGALAYQRDFPVLVDGKPVSAVDYILEGGKMNGWTVQPVIDSESGRRGLRALLEEGTATGQGHADQWLAVLSQCNLKADQTILLDGETFTMSDYVAQVQYDVPRNLKREYSWTLIGLTGYLPTTATWTAMDGKEWSIERLVGIEAEQSIDESACGGSHRLIGMAMAINRHVTGGGELTGAWKEAEARVQECIELARRYQNPDGSFSTRYFAGPGSSPDLAQNLGTTGHTLEFLTLALTDEQLREPWVQRAVVSLCDLFQRTRSIPLECGALYHAAHGLVVYRERIFGPRSYVTAP